MPSLASWESWKAFLFFPLLALDLKMSLYLWHRSPHLASATPCPFSSVLCSRKPSLLLGALHLLRNQLFSVDSPNYSSQTSFLSSDLLTVIVSLPRSLRSVSPLVFFVSVKGFTIHSAKFVPLIYSSNKYSKHLSDMPCLLGSVVGGAAYWTRHRNEHI